jgi:hypothetical protein
MQARHFMLTAKSLTAVLERYEEYRRQERADLEELRALSGWKYSRALE